MIIDNASIKMQSSHHEQQRTQRKQTLQVNNLRPENRLQAQSGRTKDQLKLSTAAKTTAPQAQQLDLDKQITPENSLTIEIIRRMFKQLTGQDIQLFFPQDLQSKFDSVNIQMPTQAPVSTNNPEPGLIYQQSITYSEMETTTFSAQGVINTQDGQNLSFSLSLSMSRSFYLESNLTLQTGEAAKTDPLVINFAGNAAELTNTRFQFDIDADGTPDQIAGLKSNSGLLALDKNQDGKINDGSELFGPNTGNGFAELAKYDEDNNQFIDAADSIYKQLRIWQRNPDGSQQLLALGEKDIGAIFLGHVSTPFQLKAAEDNHTLGDIASSSVYFGDHGQVGTVQQINFTV